VHRSLAYKVGTAPLSHSTVGKQHLNLVFMTHSHREKLEYIATGVKIAVATAYNIMSMLPSCCSHHGCRCMLSVLLVILLCCFKCEAMNVSDCTATTCYSKDCCHEQ